MKFLCLGKFRLIIIIRRNDSFLTIRFAPKNNKVFGEELIMQQKKIADCLFLPQHNDAQQTKRSSNNTRKMQQLQITHSATTMN